MGVGGWGVRGEREEGGRWQPKLTLPQDLGRHRTSCRGLWCQPSWAATMRLAWTALWESHDEGCHNGTAGHDTRTAPSRWTPQGLQGMLAEPVPKTIIMVVWKNTESWWLLQPANMVKKTKSQCISLFSRDVPFTRRQNKILWATDTPLTTKLYRCRQKLEKTTTFITRTMLRRRRWKKQASSPSQYRLYSCLTPTCLHNFHSHPQKLVL